jgi:pyrroline-5-carboxylate reductase
MKIGFIGGGTMGEAMIKSLLAKGSANPAISLSVMSASRGAIL